MQVSGQPVGKVESDRPDARRPGARSRCRSTTTTRRCARGTRAIVRQASLSGIANRYVDLDAPRRQNAADIPDGGVIEQDATTSAVDLDQLFNTFDAETRKDLQQRLQGLAPSSTRARARR